MSSVPYNGSRGLKALALLLLAVGICALAYLLKLRFNAGDSLPRGSSLRSDPLGMEVLFESLNSSGVAVAERNYFELQHAELEKYDMLVFSHAEPPRSGVFAEELHSFVTNHGGRLLITLKPETHVYERKRKVEEDKSAGGTEVVEEGQKHKKSEDKDRSSGGCSPGLFSGNTNLLWYTFEICELKDKPKSARLNPEYECADYELPQTLPVRTVAGLSTNLLDNGWQAVYSCSDIPVVVERNCGGGSVVLSSLSYPFSNEAMRAERETGFLLWSFGGSRRILFDESHFGLVISRTVAKLIRKNNLHYALMALLIPVILYFRLAAISLIPRYKGSVVPRKKLNEGSGSALSKLLMRSVPASHVVSTALEGWREDNRERICKMPQKRRDAIEELVHKNHKRAGKFPREKEIVAAYNEVVDLLNEDD